MDKKLIQRTWRVVMFALITLAGGLQSIAGLADDFVNPYAGLSFSEAVSNQVKTLTWCSLGTSVTDFDNDPAPGRTQGYQSYTMELLGWDHAKLLNVGHSGSTVGLANDFPKTTPYDIYTIEFGINDWSTGHIVGTISDYENYKYGNAVRWHNFAACYRYVIEGIRAANPNAIIVLTTPRKGYGYNGKLPDNCDDLTLESSMTVNYWDPETQGYLHERTRLADYAALIRQIAAKENLVLCDWYAYAADQDNLAELSVDTALHPNDEGYRIMAQMLAPKILSAVNGDGFCAHARTHAVEAESATCESAGHTAGVYCDDCLTYTEGHVVIPALGHDYVGVVTKAPTKTTTGVRTYTCSRCPANYTETIPVLSTVACLRNISCVVAVGADLTLPSSVKGLDAQGALLGDVDVTWPAPVVSFSQPGIETVTGRATHDVTKTVTASIRVAPHEEPTVNVSPSAVPTTTDAQCKNAQPLVATTLPVKEWVTSNRNQESFSDTLTWSSEQELSFVDIYYLPSHTIPDVVFTDENGSAIAFTEGDGETTEDYIRVRYTFNKVSPVTALTCTFTWRMKNKWVTVSRIWAFATDGQGSGGAVVPNTAATLSEVTVDGVPFAGFDPDVYDYVVLGKAIAAVSTDNAAMTFLPEVDEHIRVVTLSEDGKTSQTYAFEMASVRYLRNVAVPASRGQGPSLPPVVKGLSASGVIVADVPVVWDEVAPPATATLYSVAGHAVADASLTVTASVRVVEPTGEASDSVNVALATKGGSVTLVIKDTADETRTKEQGYVIDEVIPTAPTWGERAPSRPNSGKTNCDVELTLTFGKTEQIGKVCVFYEVNAGQSYGLPSGVAFYDESGNTISYGEPTVSDFSDAVKKYEYRFVTPKALGKLKIVLESKTSKFISLVETEAWSTGAAVADLTPLTGAKPGMIRIGDKALAGYDPEVLTYKVWPGTVTATFGTEENANMGITVLPRKNKVTRVIALSEDGLTMRTYELTSNPGLIVVCR